MDDRLQRHALLLLLTACLLAGGRAQASELGRGSTFVAGTGWFDCNRRHDQAAEMRLEYRSRPLARGLRAVAVTLATTDGSLFVGTGVAFELGLGRWDVTPTFVPGVYRQGDGRDLGYPLEFRSQLEIGHRFRGGPRIALAFSHLSNAGLGSRNPGQESLTINYEWTRSRRKGRDD
jgi:lipid A 3-O-deacylase